ncbi:MAG: SUMF1/EgtB/PvdO family nonheme iron enzyme [Planctomycetes bacterium]|nr:SUMF1/EgtB/PvdO family nonheme iron enzyme [Planctomycetota bacterium]
MRELVKVTIIFVPLTLIAGYVIWKHENDPSKNKQNSDGGHAIPVTTGTTTTSTETKQEPNKEETNLQKESRFLEEFIQKRDVLKNEQQWEKVDELVSEFEPKFILLKDKFELFKHDLLSKRKEAEGTFAGWIEQAEKYLAQDKCFEAMKCVKRSIALYPNKKQATDLIVNQIKLKLITDMVTVPESTITIKNKDNTIKESKVPTFRLSKYEITSAQYSCFIMATNHLPPQQWRGTEPAKEMENIPIVLITYFDAQEFAKWIGKRLPTSEELEAACSYNDSRIYPWGNEFTSKENEYNAASAEYCNSLGKMTITTVGLLKNGASKLGIHDLAGNVWEWTSTKVTIDDIDHYVIKGGSYLTFKEALTCSSQMPEDPNLRHYDLGFRVAE